MRIVERACCAGDAADRVRGAIRVDLRRMPRRGDAPERGRTAAPVACAEAERFRERQLVVEWIVSVSLSASNSRCAECPV